MPRGRAVQLLVLHPYAARHDGSQSADQGQHGRLAGAGRPHHDDQFAGRDVRREVEQDLFTEQPVAEMMADAS